MPSHKSGSGNQVTHRPLSPSRTNQEEEEMDFSLSIISAMRHQEETGYATGDFLHQHDPPSAPVGGPLNQSQSSPVSVECRNLMVSWCYQVVDYCRFRRETVEIAMSYLDRFCCTALGTTARTDRKIYQLAAMTCLYTACKIHEPEAMDPKLVSNLSRGAYSPKEVEEMESMIVEALQWRLNPPTSLSFVRQLLDLIPLNVISQQLRQAAYDITKYQTELAVSEREFIQVKASTVAYGALMNALESVGVDSKVLAQIGFAASQAIGISDHDDHIYQVQSWLYEAVIRQPSGGITMAPVPPKQSKASRRASMGAESPRTITDL